MEFEKSGPATRFHDNLAVFIGIDKNCARMGGLHVDAKMIRLFKRIEESFHIHDLAIPIFAYLYFCLVLLYLRISGFHLCNDVHNLFAILRRKACLEVEVCMPRVAITLKCEPKVRQELERISKSRTEEIRLVERAKIILCCLSGKRNDEVAAELDTQPLTVGLWRKRFAAHGLAGLYDKPRSGKPAKYQATELRQRIIAKLEEPPPAGMAAHWLSQMILSGAYCAKKAFSCGGTDPEFSAKSADIIGLYLAPPQKALVLCVDEKPSIQALERTVGYVQTSSGKIVRGLKSTYKRHGTINLFAALDVAAGTIQSKTTVSKKRLNPRPKDVALISPLEGG